MSSRKKIDPTDYENRSFTDEFSDAIANKTLIKAVPGKSIIEVAREQHFGNSLIAKQQTKMKKALVAVLVCAASTFAAWDYFPVIGEDKGEAKIAYYQGRRGGNNNGWRSNEFKIRYSPMSNLEVMSKYSGDASYHSDEHHVLGARYQVMPNVSAGLDIGFPLPAPAWIFTPNAQFSMPLTDALQLGTTAELIIPTEDPRNEYTDVMYFKVGAQVDLTLGQNVAWVKLDLSSGFGEDSNKAKASDSGKGFRMSPAVGYIANVGNLALGTSLGVDFGEKSGNDPHNTIIAVDAAIKF